MTGKRVETNEAPTEVVRGDDLFRILFDLATSAIFISDEAGLFLDVNRAACRRLGQSREELMRLRWPQIATGDFCMPLGQLEVSFRDHNQVFRETALVAGDGHRLPVEVSIRRIRFHHTPAFLMIARDIDKVRQAELRADLERKIEERTVDLRRINQQMQFQMIERREAEQALMQSEKKFRLLYDSMSDAFIRVDMTGMIVEFNRAFCEMIGLRRDEIMNLTCKDITPEKWHAMEQSIVDQQVLIHGHSDIYEKEYRRKDGTVFPVELRTFLIRNEAGQPESMGAIVRDISARKRAEAEQKRMAEHLLQSQKLESLGALAGGIAHDFNNTLMAIVGNIDLALASFAEDAPEHENLVSAQEAAFRASDLCRQMLAYAGKGRFLVGPIRLDELIREAGVMIEASLSKKIAIQYELPGSLPLVHGDTAQLRQVLMNLVVNAAEAIGDRAGTIALRIGEKICTQEDLASPWIHEPPHPGRYVFLEVQDNGCGICPSVLPRIFDPFFSSKFAGRGLGLAAVLGIVNGHKGSVVIRSEPGVGSVFRVYFPAIAASAETPQTTQPAAEAWKGEGCILLVDDDETVRALGACMLEMMGFTVITATNGREAIERFHEEAARLRLVILDLTMPEMDGREAFAAMQQIDSSVPVLMSSGYTEQEITQRFNGCAIAGFLQKPYRRDALQQTIRSVLERPAAA